MINLNSDYECDTNHIVMIKFISSPEHVIWLIYFLKSNE